MQNLVPLLGLSALIFPTSVSAFPLPDGITQWFSKVLDPNWSVPDTYNPTAPMDPIGPRTAMPSTRTYPAPTSTLTTTPTTVSGSSWNGIIDEIIELLAVRRALSASTSSAHLPIATSLSLPTSSLPPSSTTASIQSSPVNDFLFLSDKPIVTDFEMFTSSTASSEPSPINSFLFLSDKPIVTGFEVFASGIQTQTSTAPVPLPTKNLSARHANARNEMWASISLHFLSNKPTAGTQTPTSTASVRLPTGSSSAQQANAHNQLWKSIRVNLLSEDKPLGTGFEVPASAIPTRELSMAASDYLPTQSSSPVVIRTRMTAYAGEKIITAVPVSPPPPSESTAFEGEEATSAEVYMPTAHSYLVRDGSRFRIVTKSVSVVETYMVPDAVPTPEVGSKVVVPVSTTDAETFKPTGPTIPPNGWPIR